MNDHIIQTLRDLHTAALEELLMSPLELTDEHFNPIELQLNSVVDGIETALRIFDDATPFGISQLYFRDMQDAFRELCGFDQPEFDNTQIEIIEMRFRHLCDMLNRELDKLDSQRISESKSCHSIDCVLHTLLQELSECSEPGFTEEQLEYLEHRFFAIHIEVKGGTFACHDALHNQPQHSTTQGEPL